MGDPPNYNPAQAAAHYKALAAAARDARKMAGKHRRGRNSSGGDKPPRRGCLGWLFGK
jgi:hypothetical protein